MFGDPLGGLLFGGEALDYFRLAIGPKNIDHPAKSGITFSRHDWLHGLWLACAWPCPGAQVRYRRGLYVLAQSRARIGEQASRKAADQAPRRVLIRPMCHGILSLAENIAKRSGGLQSSGNERRVQHSSAAHQKEGPDRASKTRTDDEQAAFPCHCSDVLARREKS